MESQEATDLSFDPDALRQKYREERDKRLRADGNEQYIEITGDYSDYNDDPYIETAPARAAYTDHTEIIVIGGGFGGLLTGARLKEAGFNDLRLIEKVATLVGPGTGTVTRAPPAIRKPTSTCRSAKNSATCRRISMRLPPKFSRTANTSQTTLTSTPMPASAPK